jgi:hypothetical protein
MKTTSRSTIAAFSVAALMTGASTSLATEVFTFGSNNDGLAGFTQSPPVEAGEPPAPVAIWTTNADSLQYRNQDTGTQNSSLLRAFSLDRTVGRSYRMEGIVTLTDGYADDNNRVGFYLFGDTPVVPNEDEVGAIGLIFNSDDSSANGPPGGNKQDNLNIRVGIDASPTFATELRNQATTPYSQDLFGTAITFTVDIMFTNDGVDDNIEINATMTDSSGDETKASATVLAADYTGDYFGFVTRARARNYVEGGPNSPEGRSLPWVMDYVSFSFTDLSLSIADGATPGNYDFSWGSKEGKLYDLVSSTDLSSPPLSWDVWDGRMDLAPDPGGTNTLADVPGGGNTRRFFAVLEKDPPPPPPLLEEAFDAAGPGLPADWVAVNATTVWDVGDPSGLPGLLDGNGTNCAGTNVVAGAYADEVATVTLTSPAVAIPAGGATLGFRQYIDSDAANGDVGAVRLLDENDLEIVEGDFPVTGIDGAAIGWTDESFPLPPSAAGQSVKVVFELATAADTIVYNGFYIDDVVITAN